MMSGPKIEDLDMLSNTTPFRLNNFIRTLARVLHDRYAKSDSPVCPTAADGRSEERELQSEAEDLLPGDDTQQSVRDRTVRRSD